MLPTRPLATRTHLLWLVLGLLLPLALLLVGSSLERQSLARQRTHYNLRHQLTMATQAQQQLIEGAHQLLATLASLPEVQQRRP